MTAPSESPPLTAAAVHRMLRTQSIGRALHILAQVASTNSTALSLAQAGAPDGTVVVAEEQTVGRGRLGRSWHSPPGANLYCSILLRTVPPPERLPGWLSWIPLVSGVAVLRTVQAVAGFAPTLKWPNDVLVGDRKLGGVLCESSGFGTATAVMVVGIGVNVNESRDSFPDELRSVATSLFAETGRRFDRVTLLAGLLSEVETRAAAILSTTPAAVREEYAQLCSTLGRPVQVTLATGESFRGLADSIEPDGGLRVIHDRSGQGLTIRAGDVVHLR